MVSKNVPVPIAIIIMILVGLAIGAWQGYWIAFKRIPPFIVTLAGMFIFRGLSNVILNGLTVAPMPDSYLNLFNTYVPDIFGGSGFNITCMLAGIVACVVYVLMQLNNRNNRVKKGYEIEALPNVLAKTAIICLVILTFMFKLSQHKGIPTILVWVVIIVMIYSYITSKTTTGRYFYAVGGNEKATKLSGINTDFVYFKAYLNMAFLASVAGMITLARLNSANPTAGTNYEMDAIGSCFIGGASAYGGIGTVPGVIVGATLMGVINLGMNIMGVDANYQKVVKGLVLLAAVIFDVSTKKKQA
jgi:putative multiple sugar transport system permease protein